MKYRYSIKLFFGSLLMFFMLSFVPFSLTAGNSHPSSELMFIELVDGWQFRWGDSPLDRKGRMQWLFAQGEEAPWQNLGSKSFFQSRKRDNFIWYRIRLPQKTFINPAVYLPHTFLAMEAYLDTTMIYRFGKLQPHPDNKFAIVVSHVFPITTDYGGRYLYLRIFSNFAGGVGIYAGPHSIKMGNENALLKALIKENSDNVMIGFLLIFIGAFSIFIFFIRFNRRRVLPLTFGAFAFFLGVFYVSVDESGFLFVGPEVLRYYLRLISYLLFPVGMYAFIERILGGQIILRRIWQLHLLYGTIALLLDVFNILPLPRQQTYYSWFFVTTIVTTFIIVLKAAWHGNREARIFLAGFLLFGLTGLHDILMGLEIIPPWEWLSQWGALIFVLSLGYLVERNFAQTRRKLERYSRELEIKTRKLNKYSQVLEEKVAERTQDLNRKNQELEDTLMQLKEMQQQLIFREKMASLGNLVAGVAHEVNNPIGAVNSSADVAARCITKIEEEIQEEPGAGEREINTRIQKPLRLLKESTAVIVTAGQRISEIVKSLKNFARLDESEYQTADIHEGIESTLTLVRHKLKDRVEIVKEYGHIPEIECFPNQLNQVFMNIFLNAAQAIEDKGVIRIKTSLRDGNVSVEISDTGKGIPPDQIKKIFDPGFTTKSRGIGTGLGLSISYNIIEKHHGELGVSSEMGKGTTFTIILPVKQRGNQTAKLEG